MSGMNVNTSFTDIVGSIGSLFGTSSGQKGSTEGTASSETTATLTGETRDRLELDEEAIAYTVRQILEGPQGLASIFAGEQNAGIFNSSVAANAAGDLSARIVGELARLSAERVQSIDQSQTSRTEQEQESQTKTKTEQGGVLEGIGDFFGGLF